MAYVYQITHKTTKEYYIGYTKHTIGVDYFTSSNHVSFSEETVDDWDIHIIGEYEDSDTAYDVEQRLIEQHIEDPLNINRTYVKEGQRRFRIEGDLVRYHNERRMKDPLWVEGFREATIKGAKKAKAKKSAKQQAKWADPVWAEKMRTALKNQRRNTPGRAAAGRAIAKLWKTPEYYNKVNKEVCCIKCRRVTYSRCLTNHIGSSKCTTEPKVRKKAIQIRLSCIYCRKETVNYILKRHQEGRGCKKV